MAALLRAAIALLLLVIGAAPASAHLTPNSVLTLDFRTDRVDAELLVPMDQLGLAIGRPVQAERAPALRDYFAQHIGAVAADGRRWRLAIDSIGRTADAYGSDLRLTLRMLPPAGASPRAFTLLYSAVIDRVPNHFVMVLARRDFAAGKLGDDPSMIGALQATTRTLRVDRAAGTGPAGFGAAVRLGMRHIAEGRDHLLFLFTLLIAAPLVARFGRWQGYGGARHTALGLLRVVSAFTVGHSLTLLAGAAFGWRLPPRPVEVLIAVSILISAVHALRPLFAGREGLVAGLFGLVHGLAFAAVLGEFLFDPWEKAQAILGFNIGIELIQLAVVAAAMPALMALAPLRGYGPLRVAAGCLSALAATIWILNRAFGRLDAAAARADMILSFAPFLIVPASLVGAIVLLARRRTAAIRT